MGRLNAAAGYRELGAGMKRLRQAAGLTGRQIERKTGWDPSKISRIESGRVNIDVSDLTWYLGILRVEKEVAVPLIDLCRRAKQNSGYWLSRHGEWVPDTLSSLIYHETTANAAIQYQPQLVPGLLQTESYARAVIAREKWRSAADVDAAVGIRLDRHAALDRPDCRFAFYIYEHALHLVVGSAAVMYEQMLTLALTAVSPNVDVHIVPCSAGERAALGGPFTVFGFDQYRPLVSLDLYASSLWLEEPAQMDPYCGLADGLAEIAVGAEESHSKIVAMASMYERRSIRDAADQLEEE